MTNVVPARPVAHAHVSRRRIVQGAAWAAPAIMIATAAPALAVSGSSKITITSMTFAESGNSDNFYLDMTGTAVNLTTADQIMVTVVFNAGAATVSVTSNSSGFTIASSTKASDGTQTTIAQFPYDGSGAVGIAKMKFTVSLPAEIIGKSALVTFTSGGYTLASQSVPITQ